MKKFNLSEEDIIFDTTKPKGQYRKPAITHVKHYKFKSISDGINETIDWFINNYELARK